MSTKIDSGPAVALVAITPGASALARPIRGFHVGGAGNVTITDLEGTSVQLVGCQAGMYYPYPATHVTAATATSIVGLI